MLNIEDFENCIRDNLKDRNFGKERADEIIKDFRQRADYQLGLGRTVSDASTLAMKDTFDRISEAAIDKARGTAKALSVQADMRRRLNQAKGVDVKMFGRDDVKGSRGTALGHAVKSLIEHDPRFKDAPNYVDSRDSLFGQFFAMFNDSLDKVNIGVQATQKGKAHLDNIIRENFGDGTKSVTGDQVAKDVSDGWMRVGELGPQMFNNEGGAMRSLKRYTPQPTFNRAKVFEKGETEFVKDHLAWGDWDKIQHPDFSPVKPEERVDVLKQLYKTKMEDGANKIDADALRGQGSSFGNRMDDNRWFHFKDADSWLAAQAKYGDGNPFNTMVNHIDDLAHNIAVVKTFGRNPEMAFNNMAGMAKRSLSDMGLEDGGRSLDDLKAILKDKVNPMMERVMRANAMNPESRFAAFINSSSNVINSALLGSTVFVHGIGSAVNTKLVRIHNDMPVFGGMATILHSWVSDAERLGAARSGLIYDASLHGVNSIKSFNPVATYGVPLTRRVAESTLRATGLTGLFAAHKWSTQQEMMGLFHDMRLKEFGDLPIKAVMEKYGIGQPEWDAFRKGVEPRDLTGDNPGAFLRPIDAVNQKVKGAQALFDKFQYMVLRESKNMTPGSSLEASVALKGNTRPDTMMGAMLNSFATFKNFPITFMNMYSRMAMSIPSAKGRLGFLAGVAASTTLTGALVTQAKELKNGRDLVPMFEKDGIPNLAFWGKAFLVGGGAGVYGDFLFSNTSQHGDSLKNTIAGPLPEYAGTLMDAAASVGKDAKMYMAGGTDWDNYDSKTPAAVVKFLRGIEPASNLWYTQAIFQRMFWNSLENAADPNAFNKRQAKENKQYEDYGNKYYWPLSDNAPQRSPDFNLTKDK